MTNLTQHTPNTHTIYLGLGTNVGARYANLQNALEQLAPQTIVTQRSPIYQTPPWGYTDQADFLNMVVKAETELPPEGLLKQIKNIEQEVGRTATFRWGPREIDIDILLYEDVYLDTDTLTIPHPRLPERAFMLRPLADISPDLVYPGRKETIQQLLANVDAGEITPYHHPASSEE